MTKPCVKCRVVNSILIRQQQAGYMVNIYTLLDGFSPSFMDWNNTCPLQRAWEDSLVE
jgi:hypothetical protein